MTVETLLYLLLTLLLLSIMVVIHELGHFLFAKLFKVKVLEFSIGMGPAIFTTGKKKKKKVDHAEFAETFKPDEENRELELNTSVLDKDDKTVFSIRALPIGGYVSMAGEDGASDDPNAFHKKKVWQRLIITVAGAAMNILLGVLCMFALVGIECTQEGYNMKSNTIESFCIYLDEKGEGLYDKPLSCEGENPLMVGDTIVMVDGVWINTGNELAYEIMHSGNEPVDLVVLRDGQMITLKEVKFPTFTDSGVVFGQYDFTLKNEDVNPLTIFKHAALRSFSTVKIVIDGLVDLVTGRYGMDAVSGPVGMTEAVGTATSGGPYSLLYLFTLITMNLGVFNLLPLPALDGGRIIFLIIEGIRRKPLKREIEHFINTAGLMVLLALMVFITIKDIFKLF